MKASKAVDTNLSSRVSNYCAGAAGTAFIPLSVDPQPSHAMTHLLAKLKAPVGSQ